MIGVPKPAPRGKKPRRPLTRSWVKRSTKPIPQRNAMRAARKAKGYAKHLGSPFWLQLRYARFLLDRGLCVCEWCVEARRSATAILLTPSLMRPEQVLRAEAFVPIPVYYTAKGTAPWRRIRGFSTHHVRYRALGTERIEDLRTMYPHHHDATEAMKGTRKAFLNR